MVNVEHTCEFDVDWFRRITGQACSSKTSGKAGTTTIERGNSDDTNENRRGPKERQNNTVTTYPPENGIALTTVCQDEVIPTHKEKEVSGRRSINDEQLDILKRVDRRSSLGQ